MKIIIFLVLAGLSLAHEDGESSPKDKDGIRNLILEKLSVTAELGKDQGKINENDNNNRVTLKEFVRTMVDFGCILEDILGAFMNSRQQQARAPDQAPEFGPGSHTRQRGGRYKNDGNDENDRATLKELFRLLVDAGCILEDILVVIMNSDRLGRREGDTELLSKVAGDAWASESLNHMLTKHIPGLADSLNGLWCKKDPSALPDDEILKLIIELGCLTMDGPVAHEITTKRVTQPKEKSLKKTRKSKSFLKSMLDTMKGRLVKKGILNDDGCVVKEVLGDGLIRKGLCTEESDGDDLGRRGSG